MECLRVICFPEVNGTIFPLDLPFPFAMHFRWPLPPDHGEPSVDVSPCRFGWSFLSCLSSCVALFLAFGDLVVFLSSTYSLQVW